MFSARARNGRRGHGPRAQPDPIDPDVDLRVPGARREWSSHRWVLPVIALGGMIGALARHELEVLWAAAPEQWPWATFVTNASGCVLIGMLMVQVVEVGRAHPLLRPFVGVGLLGGYTTFSTYMLDTRALLAAGRPGLAAGYLFGTVVLGLVGVFLGVLAGRATLSLAQRPDTRGR